MSTTTRYPELGCYALPGHVSDPTQAIAEITDAERLGFGSVWISERFSSKNADVLSGAAAVLSPSMGIAAGLIQNMPLRHPLVTAGYAATMAKLSGDRFALGVGRGTDSLADATGTPRLTFQVMEDYITILRQLWDGATVNYEGPLGRITNLRLGADLPTRPPIIMAAMGSKTLEWAGRHCDGVVFNSLWTPEAVEQSAQMVRQGAEKAGRDPASVRIWSIMVTACDVAEESMLHYVVRRMNTYLLFPAMFDAICDANGWQRSDAVRLREALKEFDKNKSTGTMGDESTTRDLDELRHMATLYPREWIERGNAVGSGEDGAQAALARIKAGADGILFHGSPPSELAGVLDAWSKIRPATLSHAKVNPGL
ncbi:MAG: TIGR03857 family LLM class F420-dependent oxidoreductase [Tissierellales bacterium]